MENHIFSGKTHYVNGHFLYSYVGHYQGVCSISTLHRGCTEASLPGATPPGFRRAGFPDSWGDSKLDNPSVMDNPPFLEWTIHMEWLSIGGKFH